MTGTYDLIVIGGGTAGNGVARMAALSAARVPHAASIPVAATGAGRAQAAAGPALRTALRARKPPGWSLSASFLP